MILGTGEDLSALNVFTQYDGFSIISKKKYRNRKICQVNLSLKIDNPENLSIFFVNLIIERFLK